jgi:iron complex outermembrane receptor protein
MMKTMSKMMAAALAAGWPAVAAAADDRSNEYLDLDITQLMNITVTSVAKKEQPLADAAAAVFVITQEDIRRSGVNSIPDALAMAPGLQVAKISASKWSVSSRGFAGFISNKLLVLIDGRSVYSPAYSGIFWDVQNTLIEDVERIEVIRGPGGTLWGANAVNGIINIITKNAADTVGGLVRATAGNQETFLGGTRYGAKLGEATYGRVYVFYDNHASNSLVGSGADAEDDWQAAQTGFRMDGRPGGGGEWTFQGDLYKNTGDQVFDPLWISQPPFRVTQLDELDNKGGNLLGRYLRAIGPDSSLTFQAYYDNNSRDDAVFDWTFNTVDLDLQYETMWGQRQDVIMGAAYRFTSGDVDEDFQVYLPDRDDNLYSAFLQDEINLVRDTMWLTLGGKYEHNDYTGDEWQPSAKILWKPADEHSLWTSVARAVRTPSMAEQYGRITMGVIPTPAGPGLVSITGYPEFDSEILYAYEAGYRWQALDNLSFDLALFYNDYDDIYTLQQKPSFAGYDFEFVNALAGTGQGVELAADWKATQRLSFVFTYSYLDLDISPEAGARQEVGSLLFDESSPQNQASIRSSLTMAEGWQLNIWWRYTDPIKGLNRASLLSTPVEVDSSNLIDINLIWAPCKDLEIMLAVQNLTNDGTFQYFSEYSVPATEIDRSVYGKITWRY